MSNELQTLWEYTDQFFINQTCDSDTGERSVYSHDFIVDAIFTLLYEFLTGSCLGFDEFTNIGKFAPFLFGTIEGISRLEGIL